MKRISLLLTLAAFCLTILGQTSKVTLTIAGLADGTALDLCLAGTYKDEPASASATVQQGKASFSLPCSDVRTYYLRPSGQWGSIKLCIGPDEDVKVSATATVTTRKTKDGEEPYTNFSDVSITDAPSHTLYLQKMPDREAQNRAYEKYHKDYKSFTDAVAAAREAKDTAKVKELWASADGKAFQAAEKAFFDGIEADFQKAVLANKETFWAPLIMCNTLSYLTPDQKSLYEQFSDEAKNSFYGKVAATDICPPDIKGKALPDVTCTNWDTKQTSTLRALSKGKKVILLDFWASWCNPCRKEIPNVKAMYAKYKDRGFEVVSVSADKDDKAWKKALQEEQLPWPNFRDADHSIQNAYNVKMYPTMYLLTPDGKVIAENARGEKLQQLLAELFK